MLEHQELSSPLNAGKVAFPVLQCDAVAPYTASVAFNCDALFHAGDVAHDGINRLISVNQYAVSHGVCPRLAWSGCHL